MIDTFFGQDVIAKAPVLKYFQEPLQRCNFQWEELNLKHDILDCFSYIDNVFSVLNVNYDIEELNYIYNGIYSMAGFADCISALNQFFPKTDGVPDLEIIIDERILETGRYYDIKVKTSGNQVIKNYYLFSVYFKQLCADLLYYNNLTFNYIALTFEFSSDVQYKVTISHEIMNHKYLNMAPEYIVQRTFENNFINN